MTIAELIASERKRLKLSLRSFGAGIGASQTAVADWEKGRRIPDSESCRKIARYLRLPEDDILRMAGHRSDGDTPPPPPVPPWLAATLSELGEEDLESVHLLARRLLEVRQRNAAARGESRSRPASTRARRRPPQADPEG